MTRKNDDIASLRALATDRARARDNLRKDSRAARERLKPSNLIAEAGNRAAARVRQVGDNAISGVRAHPGITATVAATATLIAMRRPIARLIANNRKSDPDPIEE